MFCYHQLYTSNNRVTTDWSQFSVLQKLDIIILCIQAQYHYQNFMVDYKHYQASTRGTWR